MKYDLLICMVVVPTLLLFLFGIRPLVNSVSKTVVVMLILISSVNSFAQTQVGFKHGISWWMKKPGDADSRLMIPQELRMMYDKELAVRFSLNNKITIENGIQYYSKNTQANFSGDKEAVYQLNVHIQYDVSSPAIEYMLPQLKKLRSFAGVNFSNRVYVINGNYTYTFMSGITYSHILPVSKSFSFGSQFSYNMLPFDYLKTISCEMPERNRRLSWYTSVYYTF